MNNNEKEIVYNPSIAKIGKNLYRTTIPETEEIFTGNLDDTLDLLDKNCEKVNFKRFLNSFREGNSGISTSWDGTGNVLYYSNNKIFLCSREDVEKYNSQIYNCFGRYSLLKGFVKPSTIKWEKRANSVKDNELFLNKMLEILK